MTVWFEGWRSRKIEPLLVDDHLKNIINGLGEPIRKSIDQGSSEPGNLAYFTLLSSSLMASNFLHIMPRAAEGIGSILLESRLYFDCLWQLDLLRRFDDQEKVRYLYAPVDFAQYSFWMKIFEEDDSLRRLFAHVVYGNSPRAVSQASKRYIQGRRSKTELELIENVEQGLNELDIKPPDDSSRFITQNAVIFGFRLCASLRKVHLRKYQETLHKIFGLAIESTFEALSFKLLRGFDLQKCEVIKFPENFYRKPE